MTVALMAHSAILAKSSGITLDPIAKPIAAVLAFFYMLVPNYGVAIILLTVAMMVILTPLTIKQTRSMLVMQKLQPQLKRLQEEHKNDRAALNEAVMALYKEHNASPLGGCLPMLLPFPVFFALFRVLEGLSRKIKGKSVPKYLKASTSMYRDIVAHGGTLKAFGMDLSKSAGSVKGSFLTTLPFFALLLLMVGTQYYQQRQLTSRNPAAAQGQQAQIMKFFPILFGVLSIRFPAGVVVYWTVSNIIRIFQQWAMYRYDPKVKALVEQDVKEVEDRTREIDAAKRTRPRFRDILTGGATVGKNDPKAPTRGTGGRNAGGKPSGGRALPPSGKGPTSGKPPAAKNPPANSKPTPANGKPTPANGKQAPAAAKGAPADAKAATTNGKPTPANGRNAKAVPATAKAVAPESADTPAAPLATPADSTGDAAPISGAGGRTGGVPASGAPKPRTTPGPSRTGGTGARSAGNRGRRTRRGR